MFGWFKKKAPVETGPDRSCVVPRIKTLKFTAALKEMGIPDDQLPFTQPLVADLLVTYAFDLPGASGAALAELGISPEETRSVAVENLRRVLPQIGTADVENVHRIVTGENLEACTLLAGPFWDQVATKMPGEIVVAVPSRDIVLFCSSQSPEGIANLRELSQGIVEEAGTHGLSERLLVWRQKKWAEFRG